MEIAPSFKIYPIFCPPTIMFLHLHFSQAAMRRVFALFDKDGNGEIDRAELQQVFLELGKFFTEDEVRVRNV